MQNNLIPREPNPRSAGPTNEMATEHELIRKAQAGDAQAFDGLVTCFRDRIFRVVCHMLGSESEAEDVTQEVFVRAYRSLGRFRGECGFFSWLYRIASNQVYTAIRRVVRRRRVYEEAARDFCEISNPDCPDPERLALRDESQSLILDALQQVDPRLREAVVLKDLEELEISEIAGILQVPEGTVKSRIFRGREDLRRILQSGKGGN